MAYFIHQNYSGSVYRTGFCKHLLVHWRMCTALLHYQPHFQSRNSWALSLEGAQVYDSSHFSYTCHYWVLLVAFLTQKLLYFQWQLWYTHDLWCFLNSFKEEKAFIKKNVEFHPFYSQQEWPNLFILWVTPQKLHTADSLKRYNIHSGEPLQEKESFSSPFSWAKSLIKLSAV